MKRYSILFLILIFSCKITPYSGSDVFNKRASWPEDDGVHYKNSLEWWYFTGHLKDKNSDREYGVEYVFFHFTPRAKNDFLMVNVAITDVENEKFYYEYKIKRQKDLLEFQLPLDLQIEHKDDTWTLSGQAGEYHLKTEMVGEPLNIDLTTKPEKPVLLHNDTGYEQYGDYTTAGYVSYPRLKTEGTISIEGEDIDVTGEMWYDRQWNCIGVFTQEVAWDWFSIQFDGEQEELMIYQLYNVIDSTTLYGGAYYTKDNEQIDLGADVELKPLEYWKSPKSNITYPVKWQIIVPELEIDVISTAVIPEQELKINFGPFTALYYWEGMCNIKGSRQGKPVVGNSYIEMTNRGIR
ncbi:MAG: lipocalin-like domain-containing protein [Candidatus Cyclobacteriaceae bacterium M2_1C_046]